MTSIQSNFGEELLRIRESLTKLDHSYKNETQAISQRLNQLEYRWRHGKKEETQQTEVSTLVFSPAVVAKKVEEPTPPESKASPEKVKPEETKAKIHPVVETKASVPPKVTPPKPLPPAVQMLLHPFNQAGDYVKGVYQHYREEGKLPVFFMTLGGVLALLFGFGYLMQLGITLMLDHLSERVFLAIKLVASFAASTGIILWGRKLINKGDLYRDFGAAIIGLGIAINYLLLYFIGDNALFPLLRHPVAGWSLALVNSAIGVWLALKQEARIVAVISLLGGAFVPFYLHSATFSIFYLGYLWVLSFTAIWLSQRIDWQPLRMGAFLVFAFLVEWIWFQHPERFSLVELAIGIHAFVYLFVSAAIRNGNKWREKFDIHHLFLLAASIGIGTLNLFLLFQTHDAIATFGWVLVGNAALISFGLGINYEQLSSHLRWIAFLVIGGLVGLAIPSILDQAWMGLAWAFEGMLLLLLGHKFAQERLRIEAMVLLGIAGAKMVWFLPLIIKLWSVNLWNTGFIQWICIGLSMAGLWTVYHFFAPKRNWEKLLKKHILDGINLWVAITIMLVATWFLPLWGWLFAALAVVGLLQAGNRLELKFSEGAGFAFMALLLVPYALSVSITKSISLHEQLLPAKLSLALLGVVAFSLQSIYEKSLKENFFWPIVRGLREVVWLILPALWLKPILRLYPEHLAPALFITMIASLVLYTYLKQKPRLFVDALLISSNYLYLFFLVIVAFLPIDTIFSTDSVLRTPAYYYAYLPMIALFLQGFYHRDFLKKPAKVWWEGSFFWAGLIMFHAFINLLDINGLPLSLVFIGMSFKFLVPFGLKQLGEEKYDTYLRIPGNLLIFLGLFTYLGAVSFGEVGPMFSGVILLLMVAMALVTYRSAEQKEKIAFPPATVNPWFFHLMLPLFYLPFQASFVGGEEALWGPGATALIVLHAVILLFSIRKLETPDFVRFSLILFVLGFGKLVLYDFSHFSVLSKVLVSMGIGGIMLLGSRLFLRLRANE